MSAIEIHRAAERVMREAMAVKPGEQVVVVTDSLMASTIPHALVAAAGTAGADATLVTLTDRPRPVRRADQEQPAYEPAPPAAAAMAAADVLLDFTHPILNGTAAETAALRAGARVLRMLLWDFNRDHTESLPGAAAIEAAFLRANGVDFEELADLTRRAAVVLAQARSARITSAAGTDLRIVLEPELGEPSSYMAPGIWPNPIQCCDGLVHDAGTWDECSGGNVGLTCVDAEGVLVVDHSIPPLGLLREPITIHIEGRRAVAIEGGQEARALERWLADQDDENVYVCPAEWGVGTHRGCIDSGNFLEHEKAYGAIHVALGDDTRFGGGHAAPTHIDGVLIGGRLDVDDRPLLDDREFLL